MLELVGFHAAIAQLVERIHGKDEVSGSSPDRGSNLEFTESRPKGRDFISELTNLIQHNTPRYARNREQSYLSDKWYNKYYRNSLLIREFFFGQFGTS